MRHPEHRTGSTRVPEEDQLGDIGSPGRLDVDTLGETTADVPRSGRPGSGRGTPARLCDSTGALACCRTGPATPADAWCLWALRPNRSVEAAIDLWRHLLGSTSFKGTFRLLLRSISGEDVERYPTILTKVMGLLGEDLASDVRLMSGVATDTEIVGFCRASSAILLPYRWVSHSGQLELAYDLGVPLIAPDLGGLTSQVTFHPLQTLPIHWFDAALLESDAGLRSLAQAVGMFLHRQPESSAERERAATYRREEHTDIIERHAVLYHAERD